MVLKFNISYRSNRLHHCAARGLLGGLFTLQYATVLPEDRSFVCDCIIRCIFGYLCTPYQVTTSTRNIKPMASSLFTFPASLKHLSCG